MSTLYVECRQKLWVIYFQCTVLSLGYTEASALPERCGASKVYRIHAVATSDELLSSTSNSCRLAPCQQPVPSRSGLVRSSFRIPLKSLKIWVLRNFPTLVVWLLPHCNCYSFHRMLAPHKNNTTLNILKINIYNPRIDTDMIAKPNIMKKDTKMRVSRLRKSSLIFLQKWGHNLINKITHLDVGLWSDGFANYRHRVIFMCLQSIVIRISRAGRQSLKERVTQNRIELSRARTYAYVRADMQANDRIDRRRDGWIDW